LGEYAALLQTAEAPRSELRQFFVSGVFGRSRRAEVIQKVFDGRAHPLLVNFLLVLNDHERIPLLPVILFEAKELRNRRASRLPVDVSAAVPLTAEQIERIRQRVRESLSLEPVIDVKVDPELLGGIKLRVGDWVFDGTVRTYLNELRDQIIARSSHEIQSRRDRFSSANGD
jgi:F-type H+-transporting ATPase subunit delta